MEIVDTKDLQWASVVAVMRELGYKFDGVFHHFISGSGIKYGTYCISVGTAIYIHNTVYWNGCYKFAELVNPRLVKRVKLQWHKRSKTLICQSHKVEFCDGVNPEDYL